MTHEPDIERLAQNLDGIASQVSCVTIYDNASSNVPAIRELVSCRENAALIEGDRNAGIAFALNRIAEEATAGDAVWLVTLDQDSVSPPGMVRDMLRVAESPEIAMVTPYIVDRNKMSVAEYHLLALPPVEFYRQAARRGAMTSGSLVRLRVWAEIGGYDERFFIDYVDNDFNQRVLLAGHKIARANRAYLLHEVGRARKTWLRIPRKGLSGRWEIEHFHAFGHSPQRCYFKARNRVLFTRKYWRHIGITHEGIWQIPQLIGLTLIFESDRRAKFRAFMSGIRDGIRMPLHN